MLQDAKEVKNDGWDVTPPASKEHFYRFVLRRKGQSVRAFLTYQLSKDVHHPQRALLLIKRSRYSPLTGLLEPQDVQRLGEIEMVVSSLHSRGRAKVESQKSIVNRIYDGDFPIPGFAVAVHKHGPVPVYLLPGTHQLSVNGAIVAAKIAVYQDVVGLPLGDARPGFTSNKLDYLRSLETQPHVIFQRYLEDVAEFLFDIEHHLDFVEAVSAGAQAEAILSESVDTKLRLIRGFKSYEKNQPQAAEVARRLLIGQPDLIFTTRIARTACLFFLHEFYSLVGLAGNSNKYYLEINQMKAEFDREFGAGAGADMIEMNPDAWHLNQALEAYQAEDVHWRPAIPSETIWIRRLVDFSVFLRTLYSHKLSPQAARVFLSFHHDVKASELVRSALDRFVTERYKNTIRVLSVRKEPAATLFEEQIRARIWLSDSLVVFMPAGRGEDYTWLFREIEHALGLGKRVVIFVEEGADEEAILEQLSACSEEYLSASTRRQNRKQTVIAFFQGGVRPRFRQRSGDELESELADAMSVELDLALDRRLESILLAALQFFSPREQEAIRHIHARSSEKPRSKRDLAPLAFPGVSGKKAEKEFDTLREKILKRKIRIGDRDLEIVERGPDNTYRSMLTEIARNLRWNPGWPALVLEAKLQTIMKNSRKYRRS